MNLQKKEEWLSGTITILIAIIIFFVSNTNFVGGTGGFSIKPILYHMTIFFFFAIFLFISIPRKRLIPMGIILTILYAILDELHQFFIPGRFYSILDMGWDLIGLSFAIVIYFIILQLKKT